METKKRKKISKTPLDIRIRVYLAKERINQKEFANRCGVTPQYICKIIKGQVNISKSVIEVLKKGGFDYYG